MYPEGLTLKRSFVCTRADKADQWYPFKKGGGGGQDDSGASPVNSRSQCGEIDCVLINSNCFFPVMCSLFWNKPIILILAHYVVEHNYT